MSRRSLRLHTPTGLYGNDSLLDPSLSHGVPYSSSYSAGGPSRREATKVSKSRRSQSLLHTPKKSLPSQGLSSTFHSCAPSDTSLLSSMLDESCIQERTLVDSFWGLDEDAEFQESTVLEQTTILLPNGENSSAQTQTSMVNGYFCTDCTVPADKKEAPSSSKYTTSSSLSAATLSRLGARDHALTAGSAPSASFPPSSRDKSRRHKTDHSSFCGSMNVKQQATEERGLNQNGSLWKGMTWVFWCLGTGWYNLISLLNVFVLTRAQLLRLLLLLLPLLLFVGLWSWGPSRLLSVLPVVNMTEWGTAAPLVSPTPSQSPMEEAGDVASPFTAAPSAQSLQDDGAAASLHSERLARLERSLSRLWERVEAGDRRLEQRHGEVVRLYQALQGGLHTQTDRGGMEPWVSGLLEDGLGRLRGEMEDEKAQREESRQQYVMQQEDQESRLAQLELLLQALVLRTEEVQKRQESATPAATTTLTPPPAPVPISVGVDRESHDALLAEVERLEAALGGVREDLRGVMTGCQQARWEVLDTFQDTVSAQVTAQVRQELRSLFSLQIPCGDPDSDPGCEEADLPSSLLRWLSERYVGGADLQDALASLELRILQNVTLHLQREEEEESGAQPAPGAQTLTQTVLQTVGAAGATGVTEEHVELIVRNALKLYSQDRTGLVDYALESGGGSILSTRCSETYETKTALLSLFGLPLWYFSQSPRVTIQPDVYTGNCWAFQGSSGYLVIRLSMKIRPSAFSLEHLPKALSPTGDLSSAPRQFSVYGLDDENQEEGKLLGTYTYEEDGDAVQTYSVSEENEKDFQIVEVRVLSNWGHQEYTCLYRFRVHGEPSASGGHD